MTMRKFQAWLLVILFVGATLRLVGVIDRLAIGDDQARDLLVIKRSVENHHPFVVGPPLSANATTIFLGPLYYYLMTPAAVLTNYHPAGLAIWTAILALVAIGLAAWLGHLLGQPALGLVMAGLMAVSELFVSFSRFAWNPNLLPLATVGVLLGLWGWSRDRRWGFPLAVLAAVAATQLHITAVVFIPALCLAAWTAHLPRPRSAAWGLALAGSFLLYLPLLYHEWKHQGVGITSYLGVAHETFLTKGFLWHLSHATDNLLEFFANELISDQRSLALTGAAVLIMLCGAWVYRHLAVTHLAVATIGVSFLTYLLSDQRLYLHYFFVLLVPFFLLLAGGLTWLWNRGRWLSAVAGLFLVFYLGINLAPAFKSWAWIGQATYPAQNPSQVTYHNVETAASWILADAGPASPELLFIKATSTHNQIAYDLAVERLGRVVLAYDGILIPAYPSDVDRLEDVIKTLSSRHPENARLDPLYLVIQPAAITVPPPYADLPVLDEAQFGQVRVRKIAPLSGQ